MYNDIGIATNINIEWVVLTFKRVTNNKIND